MENHRKHELYFFINELIIPYYFYIFAYMINTNFKSKSKFLNTMIALGHRNPSVALQLFKSRNFLSIPRWCMDSEDIENDKDLFISYNEEILDIYLNKIESQIMNTKLNKFMSTFISNKLNDAILYEKIFFVTNDSTLPDNPIGREFIKSIMVYDNYEFINYSELLTIKNIFNVSTADPVIAFDLLMNQGINLLELFILDSNFIQSDKDKLLILGKYRNTPLRFIKTII